MEKAIVVIIMGSIRDKEHAEKIRRQLEEFGVISHLRVASAHKTSDYLSRLVSHYEKMTCPKVYITIAGRSNGLSGVVDGLTSSPTIACPPYSDSFSGADIFSSLRMPLGITPAVVLEPQNAAFLAIRILSLSDMSLKEKVVNYMLKQQKTVLEADVALNNDTSLLTEDEISLLK
ncbi:MAG: AIR carboxylase family protein [Treponema sp.]